MHIEGNIVLPGITMDQEKKTVHRLEINSNLRYVRLVDEFSLSP